MDTMLKTKINRVKVKISILTILIASFILFGLSFTLSSCKACDKRDDNTNNTSLDTSNSTSTNTTGNTTNIIVLSDLDTSNSTVLSKVGKYLKNKGCDDLEIKAMMDIEKEDFGENINRVMRVGYHFWYENHCSGRTHLNCGLYAMKRLLFVLGKHGVVDENLWYKYTDDELRDMIANISGYEKNRNQSKFIEGNILKTLMRDVGVPERYCKIYDESGEEALAGFVPHSLAPGCFEHVQEQMKERMIGFEARARAAANDAESAKVKAEEAAKNSNMAEATRWADEADKAFVVAKEAEYDAAEVTMWMNTAMEAEAMEAWEEVSKQVMKARYACLAADKAAKIERIHSPDGITKRIYSPDGIELPRT
jgi:hypothetical protein